MRLSRLTSLIGLGIALILAGTLLVTAQEATETPVATPNPNPTFHPTFALLDAAGENVLASGQPASTMQTCGACHDTTFIAANTQHGGVGLQNLTDFIPTAAEETFSSVEMNCFTCHAAAPNNAARVAALENGDLAWANSATLQGTGIIDGQRWNADAFNADGTVREDLILIQDPTDANCGQCHGLVHSDAQTPMTLTPGDPSQWKTLVSGQVFSPQRLAGTGLNLRNKDMLGRSWDIHAERAVGCTDCHYALNNPVFDTEASVTRPDHLQFDPRRMDFGEYLHRPLHEFANTDAETVTQFGSAERTCDSCHDAASTHTWLPYTERHVNALACETCHVPTLYAPALESVDWTALQADGTPLMTYRGLDGDMLTGFQPVLLPDENGQLAPYNFVSVWYWVAGDPAAAVSIADLQAAWFEGEAYHPDILAVFDKDARGTLDSAELALDTPEKVALIATRLESVGVENPRIVGEVQPYAIHHNVINGEWATRECSTCHTGESRLNAPFTLASYLPGGVQPTFDGARGTLTQNDDGALYYAASIQLAPTNLYVLGHDSVWWIDLFGMLSFLGVFAVALVHGGLRYLSLRRAAGYQPAEVKRVYMYSVYERQWHWLQTAAIFGLLFTGMVIHKPDVFGAFSFQGVVLVHNALAVLLVINAALSAFYHLVSGEIRQFLPRPYGFFDQAFAQAKYYLRGIFKGEPHPYEKTRERKMNPLQQITYLMILNVLLPLQIITGALMWGAQQWPDVTAQLGGLAFLAPLHTLVAWMFASFIVAHVYLTTTGHTPLTDIKAMLTGWDEIEAPESHPVSTSTSGEGSAS